VVADVQIPITGVDFLISFCLLIKCWHNQLCKESYSYPHPAMSRTHPFPLWSSFSSPTSTWNGLAQSWQWTTPPRLYTSKTHQMYFCTKMHYAVPWIPLTVAYTKLLHAWTKPPNSPRMAVHHCIGCWSKVSWGRHCTPASSSEDMYWSSHQFPTHHKTWAAISAWDNMESSPLLHHRCNACL
jgi:hypothetical protein